ncbi:hypothetical protein ACDX78_21530 [Virgibacillus oceani]
MTKKEKRQVKAKEINEIQDMINEGGLGADVYYINEGTDKDTTLEFSRQKANPAPITHKTTTDV